MHDAVGPRVEVGRVPDPVALQPEVGVEVERERTFAIQQILHHDPPQVNRTVEVHRVRANQLNAQARVLEPDIRDEGVLRIVQVTRPLVVADPRKLTVHANAEPASAAAGLILGAHPRVVDVAHAVARVEVDEERSVAQGEVARHGVNSIDSVLRAHCRNCGPSCGALTLDLAAS